MYSLLALGYFVFSTLPFTEVSAQTITITSGKNQSTTRGNNFPNPVVFRVTGVSSGDNLEFLGVVFPVTDPSIEVSKTGDANSFGDFLTIKPIEDGGEYSFYVRAKNVDDMLDSGDVGGSLRVITPENDGDLIGNWIEFTGTITDVLYFPSSSTTRNLNPGVPANTDIGDPVSATHWQNVTLTYSLDEAGRRLFTIDTGTGQLRTKAGVTYSDGSTYNVTVKVADIYYRSGGDPRERSSDTINVTITVNTRPLIENTPVTGNSNTLSQATVLLSNAWAILP